MRFLSTALLITKISNHVQLEGAVGKICELQVKPLLAIMENPVANGGKLTKNSVLDPVLYLDRLSDVFRHVAPSNGCVGESREEIFFLTLFCSQKGQGGSAFSPRCFSLCSMLAGCQNSRCCDHSQVCFQWDAHIPTNKLHTSLWATHIPQLFITWLLVEFLNGLFRVFPFCKTPDVLSLAFLYLMLLREMGVHNVHG